MFGWAMGCLRTFFSPPTNPPPVGLSPLEMAEWCGGQAWSSREPCPHPAGSDLAAAWHRGWQGMDRFALEQWVG